VLTPAEGRLKYYDLLLPGESLRSGEGYIGFFNVKGKTADLGDQYVSVMTYTTTQGRELMLILNDRDGVLFAGTEDRCVKREAVAAPVDETLSIEEAYGAAGMSPPRADHGSSAGRRSS
ncbi:MAG TPA: hypothetical protein PKW90_03665, partial [Myxococcota bacterium]|nr:hypothetical protein [Myxococcota bacterium]